MNATLEATAHACLEGAETGTMTFPQIVGSLMEAGFDGYAVDLRRATAAYYLPDGEATVMPARKSPNLNPHRHRYPCRLLIIQ